MVECKTFTINVPIEVFAINIEIRTFTLPLTC